MWSFVFFNILLSRDLPSRFSSGSFPESDGMTRNYRNRTDWLTPALALSVWAAHFFLLWAGSSIFPGQPAARWIAAVLTVMVGGTLYWLWRRSQNRSSTSTSGLGLAIAALGVSYGFVPAILA